MVSLGIGEFDVTINQSETEKAFCSLAFLDFQNPNRMHKNFTEQVLCSFLFR